MAAVQGAGVATWAPDAATLQQVVKVLTSASSGRKEQQEPARVELARLEQHADFPKYLVFLLSSASGADSTLRQLGGLTLNGWVERLYRRLPATDQAIVQELLLPSIVDPDDGVRRVACLLCASIGRDVGLARWPRLMAQCAAALATQQAVPAEGGLRLLNLLAKDCPMELKETNMSPDPPLAKLIPAAIAYMQGASVPHAVHAGYALCNLICVMPGALAANMPGYLQALGHMVRGGQAKLLPVALNSFLELTQHALASITPSIGEVAELMLGQARSPNEEARKLAAKFWGTFADATGSIQVQAGGAVDPALLALKTLPVTLFPRLLPALVEGCVFDEETMMDLPMDNTPDMGEVDRPEDVAPHMVGSAAGNAKVTTDTTGGEILDRGPRGDFGDDGAAGNWNVRAASVEALVDLAAAYGEMMWAPLQPLLNKLLTAETGEASWQSREVGIMLLGALSDGLWVAMEETGVLAELFPFLLARLADPHPVVRSTTCWTLKVFAETIVYGLGLPNGGAQLLGGLLKTVQDPRKKVVVNALEALGATMVVMEGDVAEHAGEILGTLMTLRPKCQLLSIRYLYDAVSCACEAVAASGVLATPEHAKMLLEPLSAAYAATPVTDLHYLMLAECTAAAASAVQKSAAPYATGLWHRAASTVQALLLDIAATEAANPAAVVDRTAVAVNLDILDHLVLGLGPDIAPLLPGTGSGTGAVPSLLALLDPCLAERSQRVRASAFAIVIDLLDGGVPGFVSHDNVNSLVTRCIQSSAVVMKPPRAPSAPPTIARGPLNNAVYALATLGKALGTDFKPFAPTVMAAVKTVLDVLPRITANTVASVALLLARVAAAAPTVVVPRLGELLTPWLQAAAANSDGGEKGEVQDVFIALYQTGPPASDLFNNAAEGVVFFACSWFYPAGNEPSAPQRAQAAALLQSVVAAHGAGWAGVLTDWSQNERLRKLVQALGRFYPECIPAAMAGGASGGAPSALMSSGFAVGQ